MIYPYRFEQRYLVWLGAGAFVVMAVMAAVFYLERTIILDASYQTFAMIIYDNFSIQTQRFGAVITKIFPYLAMKWHWPLDRLLWVYSLSFVIYAGVFYAFLTTVLRHQRMGMTLLMFFTLMTAHTFFWIQSEQLQASAVVLLFFGIVTAVRPLHYWLLPILFGLIVVIVYLHPLAFIPFGFLWLFFAFDPALRRQWAYYTLPLFLVLTTAYKLFMGPPTYDQGAMQLGANVVKQIGQFWHWKSNTNFLHFCLTDYYLFFPLVLLIGYHYVRQRQLLRLGLFLGANITYLVLINGAFFWGAEQFYIESYYTTISIFLAVPLLFDVLPSWKSKQLAGFIVVGIVAIRLLHIGYTSRVYERRLDWNRQMLSQSRSYGGSKFIIKQEDIPMDKLLMTWGSPFETVMLSALESPDSTRTLLIAAPDVPIDDYIKNNKAFLSPFGVIPYEVMKGGDYFHFRDTSYYQLLPKDKVLQ